MFVSIQDIFWIVLTIVTIWVGAMLGWGLYYLALILRDTRAITGNVRHKLDIVDDILGIIKGRLEVTATYLPMLVEGVSNLISHFRQENKKGKKDK